MMRRFLFLFAAMLSVFLFSAAQAEKTLTFTFTGDCTIGGEERLRNKEGSFFDYAAREGYDYFFKNYVDLFSKDDATIINLEGVLSDSNRQEKTSKTYRFRGDTDYAKILTKSFIEACSISNNHTKDFGNQGYHATVDTLKKNGIGYFGDSFYWIFEKDGIKVAFFSFVSSSYEGHRDWCTKTVQELRENEGVNAVVLCIHAGTEYATKHNPYQERYATIGIEKMGADLVIINHPHVVQGISVIDNRYVCYSLGNFCFGGNTKVRALECLLVQADLKFADDGTFLGQQLRLYPAHISNDPEINDFQPVPVTGDEAGAVFDLVQHDTDFSLSIFEEDAEYCYLPVPYLPAQ